MSTQPTTERLPADDWRSQVDAAITAALEQPPSPLSPAALRLSNAGGKRLRAQLVGRAAIAIHPNPSAVDRTRLVAAAASIELLHTGSLVHDDIIDESATRRGAETINARESNTWAVLAGDMLLARGSLLSARLGQREAQLYGDVLDALCFGQALESETVGDLGRSESSYFDAIGGKTAALMAGACRIGAMQMTDDEDALLALDAFGWSFGIAFQVIDDVADVLLTDEELGKPSMQDVREQVYTYPVIKALELDPGLAPVISGVAAGAVDTEVARRAVCNSGSIGCALDLAQAQAQRARDALVDAPLTGDIAPVLDCADRYLATTLRRWEGWEGSGCIRA